MVVAYFWITYLANFTVFSDQQEISAILPTLFYKSTLINERVKSQIIEIEIHQYKSSLLLHELFNRNESQATGSTIDDGEIVGESVGRKLRTRRKKRDLDIHYP